MFGFFIGTVSLILLVGALRRRRWHGRGGCGHGGCCDRGGCGGPIDGGHDDRGGRFWRGALRGLFERLRTTPGQERVIAEAVSEMRDSARGLRDAGVSFRDEVGKAMEAPAVDEALLGEAFAKQDELLRNAQKAFVGALSKVHEALDPEQRKELARIVGSRRFGFGF